MLFDELRRYILLPSEKSEEEIKEELREIFSYEEFKNLAEAKGLDGSEEAYEKFLEEATKFKKDPFRFQENVGFSAHFEDIPFLLHKELIIRQKEGKEPVFGCRVRIEERGYEEEREGKRVFIPYGDSKKWDRKRRKM